MARKVGSLDLQGNDFQKARPHYLSAAPGSPVDGQLYFNNTDHTMYVYDGNATTWYSTRGTGISYGSATTSAVGDSATAGVATTVSRSDHVHGREAFGAVTAQTSFGSSSANGSATTLARSDHTHGTPTAPTAASVGAVGNNGNAPYLQTGLASGRPSSGLTVGGLYVDNDDKLAYIATSATVYSQLAAFGTPGASAVGDTVAAGSATTYARSDHVHSREAFGAVTAQTAYGASSANGSAVTLARSDHTHGTVPLTSNTPSTQAIGDTAAVGTGTAPARDDHKHALPGFGTVTAQTAFGSSSANGAATTIARSDHTHGTPTHIGTDHSAISISSLSAPTADVAWNSKRITGLLDPSSAQDAATKAYVDATSTGLDVKTSVRAASTATVTVTYTATNGTSGRGQITAAPNALDGVTLAAGNRLLLKDQSTAAQNGIWVVTTLGTGANGVWDRATDFDSDAEVTSGAFTFVTEGTVNDNSGWVLTTNDPVTIGGASGTALAWAQFSGAGQITAGAGLTKTGNTLDVGQGTGIVVNADTIQVDRSTNGGKVAFIYATSIGDGTNSTYTVTHNLGTLDVDVTVFANSGGDEQDYDVVHATTNTVTVTFPFVATSSQFRVVVLG